MKVEFEVKMKTGYMYDFLINHMYRRFQGWFSIILGIAAIVLCFSTMGKVDTPYTLAYGFFGIVFILYMPFTLYTRAKRQVLLTPMFKKPLRYTVDKEGIRITQQEQNAFTPWSEVTKVIQTPQSIIVYMSRVNAFVWPKVYIGEEFENLTKLLNDNVATGKVKVK